MSKSRFRYSTDQRVLAQPALRTDYNPTLYQNDTRARISESYSAFDLQHPDFWEVCKDLVDSDDNSIDTSNQHPQVVALDDNQPDTSTRPQQSVNSIASNVSNESNAAVSNEPLGLSTAPTLSNGFALREVNPASESPPSEASSDSFKRRKNNKGSAVSLHGDAELANEEALLVEDQVQLGSSFDREAVNHIDGLSMNDAASNHIQAPSHHVAAHMPAQPSAIPIPNFTHQNTDSNPSSADSSPLEMGFNRDTAYRRPFDSGPGPSNSEHIPSGSYHHGAMMNGHTQPYPSIGIPPYDFRMYRRMYPMADSGALPGSLRFQILSDRKAIRAETASDFRFVIRNPPDHYKRLRIHHTHLTKVKHLQEVEGPMCSDTLELRATVYRAESLKVPGEEERALALAKRPGETLEDEDEDPVQFLQECPLADEIVKKAKECNLVTVCFKCKEREKRRLRRSHTEGKTKPGEDDEWLQKAARRILIFNDKPWTEWQLPNSHHKTTSQQLLDAPSGPAEIEEPDEQEENGKRKGIKPLPLPPVEEDTMAVDLKMRITCYCRHHSRSEFDGFRLIFTLVNEQRTVVAQCITVPYMITDDHKGDKKGSGSPPETAGYTYPPGLLPDGSSVPLTSQQHQLPPHLYQSQSSPNLPAAGQIPYGQHSSQQNFPTHQIMTGPQQLNPPPNNQGYRHAHSQSANLSRNSSRIVSPNHSHPDSPAAGTNVLKRPHQGSSFRMHEGLQMTPICANPAPGPSDFAVAGSHQWQIAGPSNAAIRRPVRGSMALRSQPSYPHSHIINHGLPTSNLGHMGNQIQNSRPISHGLPTSNVTYIGDQMQSLPAPDARFTESDTGSMGYPDYQPQNFNFATTGNGLPSWEPEQLDDRLRSLQSSRESSLTALGSRPASHHGDPAILVPQEFRIRIDKLIPDHGPVHGLYEIALIGYGFWEGLQVCFGGRLTTEATNYNGTALVCKVPPGAGPGRVQVTLISPNPQQVLIVPETYFTYTGDEQRQAPISLPSSPLTPKREFLTGSGGAMYPMPPPSRSGVTQALPHHQIHGERQHKHTGSGTASPPPAETPPSYEDVKAEDSRLFDLKTNTLLRAIGDAFADVKTATSFERVEASKAATTGTVTSSRDDGIEVSEGDLALTQRREVKGLKSDFKLWGIWLPALVLVVGVLLYPVVVN